MGTQPQPLRAGERGGKVGAGHRKLGWERAGRAGRSHNMKDYSLAIFMHRNPCLAKRATGPPGLVLAGLWSLPLLAADKPGGAGGSVMLRYRASPLLNPANDSRAIAAKLRALIDVVSHESAHQPDRCVVNSAATSNRVRWHCSSCRVWRADCWR